MEFLKNVVDGLTHSEERSAAKAKLDQQNNVALRSEEVVVVAPVAVETPTIATAQTGAAEITTLKAATVDTISRAPVIEETVIQENREIIQPVIHREIEKTEVRHVIQPVYQDETAATQMEERTLPAEYRGEIRVTPNYAETLQAANHSSQATIISTAGATQTTTVVNQPIVHEIIKPHIIEEVQPVIHRTVHEPHIIHERQDIYEKIVEPPTEIVETREPIYEKEVFLGHTRVEHREAL